MIYISRGEIASEKEMTVLFRNEEYCLSPAAWKCWINGTEGFKVVAKSLFSDNYSILYQLEEKGLIALSAGDTSDLNLEKYLALSRSILLYKPKKVLGFINQSELFVARWIREAPFSLMAEEIVFILEHNIEPTPNLLGSANKQEFAAKVYPDGKIENNALVRRMASAKNRDIAVSIILSLMKKGYIVLN